VPFCFVFYEGLQGRIDRCWNDREVGCHQSFESASAIAIDVDILVVFLRYVQELVFDIGVNMAQFLR
jgi:hypothetical protein